jgi:hypothetical protein
MATLTRFGAYNHSAVIAIGVHALASCHRSTRARNHRSCDEGAATPARSTAVGGVSARQKMLVVVAMRCRIKRDSRSD